MVLHLQLRYQILRCLGFAHIWLLLRQICLLVCELTSKGGWAGVNVTPASEAPERARRTPNARRGYSG